MNRSDMKQILLKWFPWWFEDWYALTQKKTDKLNHLFYELIKDTNEHSR